ncbi:MAG: ABC transporter permease, partial [Candidatus Deferrimicrobiaceae bacterium]
MTRRLLSIAANTFRETVRNKILYVILAFALVVIGLTWFLADLSMGELSRIVADVGLASIHLFGVTIAVFLGITLVSQEMERKTIYLVLSKPVPRWEFVLGKAAGLCGTILLTTSVMAVTLFAVYAAYSGKAEPGILVASAGLYLELVLLVCLATLFSTFTTPTLSAMFTLALFLIGHLSQSLFVLGGRAKSVGARAAASFLFYLLPNLEIFNWKNGVVYGEVRS